MKRALPLRAAPRGRVSLNRTVLLFTSLMLAALAPGCAGGGGSSTQQQRPTLRLSMIPTTDPGRMLRESRPLVEYLQQQTGAKVELTIPTNYAAVVEAAGNDQIDIAHFGGFTYVQAANRFGVRPLVQRDRDRNFHSVFLTQPGSNINNLADLKGRTFAFGDVNSTSGHLMPEYFMRQSGVDLEVITKAVYTGGHDATALAVANRKVDAGALDELVFERMTKEGKLAAESVRVFYTTPPYFDYVWAARKGLDPKLADAFADALLKLDAADAEHKRVLDILSATKYVRAADGDYDKLRQAAKDAGLLK
ncbi:MAG TPA: putative selenate ABC transporter substrate-binding protein [Pyrinomonadaceae bacterium]|nr:putative selenate ABC transporter substrate-binding protein [Pyrinomonadaceae bacterium]